MHVSDYRGPLRTRNGGEQRVTPLELFFDLVYVFAVTQLSHRLLEHLSLRGVLETLMLFLVVWGVWVYTAWFTNWLHPDRLPVRLVLVAVMLASLLMSVAIPEAFGKRGLMFALAYVAIQVGRTAFTFIALRKSLGTSHPLSRTFQRILTWFVGSGVVWIIGGLLGGEARYAVWLLALAVDYSGPVVGYYIPGLGRSRAGEWAIEGGHFAERCLLFVIIALGESILVTGHHLRRDRSFGGRSVGVRGGLPGQRRAVVDLLLPQCRGSSRGHCFLRGPGPVRALRLHLLPHAHDSRDHRHRRRRRTHRCASWRARNARLYHTYSQRNGAVS